jgi:transcriptional regulator with XRE-family HTH domain
MRKNSFEKELSLLGQLGKRIAYLRKQKGMTQLDLSITTGVAKSYISDLETGNRNPSVMLLQELASGLGVTLEELFRGIVPLEELAKLVE